MTRTGWEGVALESNRKSEGKEGLSGQNFLVLNFRANWPCKITLNYRVVLETSRWCARVCVCTRYTGSRAGCAQLG